MAGSAEQVVRYPFASAANAEVGVRLAAAETGDAPPHFFTGKLVHPRVTAEMLLMLSDIVATRFWNLFDGRVLLDPVVTAAGGGLRFEGVSGCAGAYVRADLDPSAFTGVLPGKGTTNVDFNPGMRAGLARIRDEDGAGLSVGREEVRLETGVDAIVEKKVKLPPRWVKSFSEVQAFLPRLERVMELGGPAARKLVASLPRSASAMKKPGYIVPVVGGNARFSTRDARGRSRCTGRTGCRF